MKHITLIIIALLAAFLMTLAGCAPAQQGTAMEQDTDAIVQEADETVRQVEAIEDVEADVAKAEEMAGRPAVVISGFEFRPQSLTIAAGESVEFVNRDGAPHTATGDTWDTGTLAKGQSEVIVFDTSGTYDFVCRFHSGMRGQIVVE